MKFERREKFIFPTGIQIPGRPVHSLDAIPNTMHILQQNITLSHDSGIGFLSGLYHHSDTSQQSDT